MKYLEIQDKIQTLVDLCVIPEIDYTDSGINSKYNQQIGKIYIIVYYQYSTNQFIIELYKSPYEIGKLPFIVEYISFEDTLDNLQMIDNLIKYVRGINL